LTPNCKTLQLAAWLAVVVAGIAIAPIASAQVPGPNLNIVGPTIDTDPQVPPSLGVLFPDVELRQQNESACAARPDNPTVLLCAFNDYRAVSLTGDAWQGIAMTRDGVRWLSRLAPGSKAGPGSLGFAFAADPTVVAVPGLAFNTFIASDRCTNNCPGGFFLQRWAELNKEDGYPYEPENLVRFIDRGASGRFIDKPHVWATLDPPGSGFTRVTMTLESGTVKTIDVPRGVLHAAFSVFVGTENNSGTKVLYTRSTDWGATWSQPTKLNESLAITSGINIVSSGSRMLAVWRRFRDTNEPDAIMYARSTDNGQHWSKAGVIANSICPFDQALLDDPATPVTPDRLAFRTSAFPVAATDGAEFRVFWQDRRFGGTTPSCTTGLSRIVSSRSTNGDNWSAPTAIDLGDATIGHQYMPAAFGAGGRIQVAWYDTRDDESGVFTPFIDDYVDDAGNWVHHTADVRGLQIDDGVVGPSFEISRYRTGKSPFSDATQGRIIQLERNQTNGRMFRKGTTPFNGDYMAVTARPFRLQSTAGVPAWVSNSNASPEGTEDSFFVAWSDSRDVRGDVFGDWVGGGATTFSPTQALAVGEEAAEPLQECVAPTLVFDRSRDQNIYGAGVRPGLLVSLPSAAKPLGGIQRGFVVYMQNPDRDPKTFGLRIANQPPDFSAGTGIASFRQQQPAGTPLASIVRQLTVVVEGHSAAARTVFVTSTVRNAAIRVEAFDPGTPAQAAGVVTINAAPSVNPEAPDYENPDYENPDYENFNAQAVEIQAPDYENKTVTFVPLNPDYENPDYENLLVLAPDYENPDYENPDYENPDYENRTVQAPDYENPDYENTTLGDPVEQLLVAGGYTDITWKVRSEGNTTGAFTAAPFIAGALPAGTQTQLIITAPAVAPSSQNCEPVTLGQNVVLVNVANPDVSSLAKPDLESPASIDAPTVPSLPNGEFNVTLRIFGSTPFPQRRVGLAVYAQQCSTSDTTCNVNPCELGNTGEAVGECEVDFTPDTIAPSFGVLPNISGVEATSATGAVVTFNVAATDDVDGSVAATCSPASGSVFALGTTAVACSASDSFGNSASASFPVNVVDTTAPVLVAPTGTIEVAATGPSGALATFAVSASDLVGGAITPVCTPASGTAFALGVTGVNCTATDARGNSSSASFSVLVKDTGAPVVTVPANLTLEATGATGALGSYAASASDAVDGAISPTCTPASGSTFAIGASTVTCSATDRAGHTGSASFMITVRDSTPPVLALPSDMRVGPTSGLSAVVTYTATATDTVDASVTVNCTPASGATFPIGTSTVSCTTTDDAGNTATGTFKVTVEYLGFAGIFYPNGVIKVGSSVPLDWQFVNQSGQRIDSAAETRQRVIVRGGKLQGQNCMTVTEVYAQDSGNSAFRYSASTRTWQFNWQTKGFCAGTVSIQVAIERPPFGATLGSEDPRFPIPPAPPTLLTLVK
jgi:hypothetical protein